jgi:AAHS family 4-hydroxybenzoate transporter-like MFS transporter
MFLVIFSLPESYRFLIVKGKNPEKVRKILNRIAPEKVQQAESFMYLKKNRSAERKTCLACCSLRICQRHGFIVVDLFHGFGDDLSLTSWLPTLMRETGATMERAALVVYSNLVVYSALYLLAGQWTVSTRTALLQASTLSLGSLHLPLVRA